MTQYNNKIIWITGASSGIGEALALTLAKKNNTLILSARNQEKLDEIKLKCIELGSKCYVAAMDLGNQQIIEKVAEEVLSRFPKIDLLINNAGISQRSMVHEAGTEIDRKIMEVNFFGQVALTKKVLPGMIQNKSGHIAITSSIVGIFGFPFRSAYSASKHALHGFFETLKIEQRENNIQVSIIIPGRIKTNISVNSIGKDGRAYGIMDEGQANGVDAGICAKKIVRSLERNKYEIYVGGKELIMVFLRKYFKKIFFNLAAKVQPT